jgi:hypothetical protein
VDSSRCPKDREAYAIQHLLGRLLPDESHTFKTHLSTCASCAEVVDQTGIIIQALRDATEKPTD